MSNNAHSGDGTPVLCSMSPRMCTRLRAESSKNMCNHVPSCCPPCAAHDNDAVAPQQGRLFAAHASSKVRLPSAPCCIPVRPAGASTHSTHSRSLLGDLTESSLQRYQAETSRACAAVASGTHARLAMLRPRGGTAASSHHVIPTSHTARVVRTSPAVHHPSLLLMHLRRRRRKSRARGLPCTREGVGRFAPPGGNRM